MILSKGYLVDWKLRLSEKTEITFQSMPWKIIESTTKQAFQKQSEAYSWKKNPGFTYPAYLGQR